MNLTEIRHMKTQSKSLRTASLRIIASLTIALTLPVHAGGISDLSRASVNASLAVPGALISG